MSWFLAFAGFAALIILHEFGHFLVAKAVGMRVERFYLFFPPAIAKVRRGETEYGIGAIPAGGFVKITGMNPDEELPPDVAARGYYAQPVWKRITVIAAGPVMNLLIAFVLLFILAFTIQETTKSIGEVDSGYPAAGRLEPGDRLVAVDGVRGGQVRLAEEVAKHDCAGEPADGCRAQTPVTVRVIREGEPLTFSLRPRYDADVERTRLGIAYAQRSADIGAPEALEAAGDYMWTVTSGTVSVIAHIFDSEQREQITGIVGSYETTRQAIEFDTRTAFLLIAVISLSLAVVNLFPFLPLDGGHIFWSIVEKVRGRPVPFSVMERSGALGFVLVLMLFAIGLSNDIGRLTGDGFEVR